MEGRALTGDACVEALLRAGFRIRNRAHGLALLVRGSSIVMVPDVDVVEEGMLKAILRSAAMTEAELEKHLAHVPTRSGFFAKHRTPEDQAAATAKDEAMPGSVSPARRR